MARRSSINLSDTRNLAVGLLPHSVKRAERSPHDRRGRWRLHTRPKRGEHRFTKFEGKSHKPFVNTVFPGDDADGEGDVEDEHSTVSASTAGSIAIQRPPGVGSVYATRRFWTRVREPLSCSNRSLKLSIMTPPSCSVSTNRRGAAVVAWHVVADAGGGQFDRSNPFWTLRGTSQMGHNPTPRLTTGARYHGSHRAKISRQAPVSFKALAGDGHCRSAVFRCPRGQAATSSAIRCRADFRRTGNRPRTECDQCPSPSCCT